MREETAKLVASAGRSMSRALPVTQVTSEDDGWGVHFRDVPHLTRTIAVAVVMAIDTGSVEELMIDLSNVAWDGVDGDMILC